MTLELEKNGEEWKLQGQINEISGKIMAEFPCGILRCTYEKHPKALYANDWMFQFLGTDENSEDWKEFIQQNIYFMIPFEERDLFKSDLQRAAASIKPIPIKHWIRNCSGGKTCFMGWIQVVSTANGGKEYVFFYIPISETCLMLQNEREVAYEMMLTGVFDAIFCIQWESRMMECIHARPNIQLPNTPGIQMICDDRVWMEFLEMVWEDDRSRVERFFARNRENFQAEHGKRHTRRMEFRIVQEKIVKDMMIMAVDIERRATLFCCREITHEKYMEHVTEEIECIRTINLNVSKSERNFPVKSWTYRLSQDQVHLLSGNDENFGFDGMLLSEFLRRNEISIEEFQTALQDGMVVLAGEVCTSETKRVLYSVQRAGIAEATPEYILFLYHFGSNHTSTQVKKPRVRIHTFGYFDVFVDGKPIVFRYEKSKEMLAILVDRKGSFVSNPYFISCLWGDEPYSEKVRSRCRQVAYRMMETLKQYGIEDIIEKVDGHRRIIPERIECDYFDYVNGKATAHQMFNGAYMSDYSWGEETLSMLLKNGNYMIEE